MNNIDPPDDPVRAGLFEPGLQAMRHGEVFVVAQEKCQWRDYGNRPFLIPKAVLFPSFGILDNLLWQKWEREESLSNLAGWLMVVQIDRTDP